jgi:hypothetical protein
LALLWRAGQMAISDNKTDGEGLYLAGHGEKTMAIQQNKRQGRSDVPTELGGAENYLCPAASISATRGLRSLCIVAAVYEKSTLDELCVEA